MKPAFLIVVLTAALSIARADDWTTTDGTSYKGVKVLSHDDGFVTIMYADGGARVPLRLLTPDLQKQFGYDAAKAAAFEAATKAQDQRDKAALRAEENAAQAQRTQQVQTQVQVQQQPAVSQQPVPTQAPNIAPPPAQPAAKIDVEANNAKIQEDQEKLDNLNVDLHLAQKQVDMDHNGASARVATDGNGHQTEGDVAKWEALRTQTVELQNEIAALRKQNLAAAMPVDSSSSPANQANIDEIKQKMRDLRDDIATMNAGLVPNSSSTTTGAYQNRIADDGAQLKVLEAQLDKLQSKVPNSPLTHEDVVAIHEKIVKLEIEVGHLHRDAAGPEFSTNLQDDQDKIQELNRQLAKSPRVPVKLSDDDIVEIRQKIAALFADRNALGQVTSGGAHEEQYEEDSEQAAALQDELDHSTQ